MKKNNKYLRLSLFVALLGEVYFYPFQNSFKFSIGVIVYGLIILIKDEICELTLAIYCAIMIFLIRNIFSMVLFNYGFSESIIRNFPSMIYYIVFGMMVKITKIKKYKSNMFNSILILSMIDCFSNILEAIIRKNVSIHIIKIMIIVAIVRSFTAYVVYQAYIKHKLIILSSEHEKKYVQLNLLISNMQAETFYLRKSMKDIENVMSKSYNLYDKYKNDKSLKDCTLEIAREVHEIKKDYNRVLNGFQGIINDIKDDETMKVTDIFYIIMENTKRYISEKNIDIKLAFNIANKQLELKGYHNLFVVINNLIINSIEACEKKSYIEIKEYDDEKNIYFKIIDTGNGIEEELLPYIFNAGFTTKYDEQTGVASTGIGLYHVKNIIEHLSGKIEVESKVDLGTTFTLIIPKSSLGG